MATDDKKPFSCLYVIKTTLVHVRKSIDISIQKTLARLGEFDNDPKSKEVLEALSLLHSLRKEVDAFPLKYKDILKESKDE